MKPLNHEELQALKNQYGLAAAIQVAEEGWSSLSVRNVGSKSENLALQSNASSPATH